MNFVWVILTISLFLSSGLSKAWATCSENLATTLKSDGTIYACEMASESMNFCTEKSSGCYEINFEQAEKELKNQLKKQSGYAGRKALRFLQRTSRKTKGVLLAYLDLMKWNKKIRVKSDFLVQTGPYGKIHITDKTTNVKCLRDIMHAAYLLESHFPNFSFQIDGDINHCSNLRSGVMDLVRNKQRVRANIAKFHSPMHTVYLTTQTKFNHFLLGKMGLYINVNRQDEIPNRLIEFRVGKTQIAHEIKSL